MEERRATRPTSERAQFCLIVDSGSVTHFEVVFSTFILKKYCLFRLVLLQLRDCACCDPWFLQFDLNYVLCISWPPFFSFFVRRSQQWRS